jgi:uncharacterized protein (DUF488 family)
MIYTGYFAQLKNYPTYVVPISICAKAPDWYKGLQYKKLAPKYSILMDYKQDKNEKIYTERFNKEVLDLLDPEDTVNNLLAAVGNFKGLNYFTEIILLCYEKPSDFCHRHIVADWLISYGYETQEYTL